MKNLIRKSSHYLVSLLSLSLMACNGLPVDFGLKVEDSLGNTINCDDVSDGFGIEVPYMVETKTPVQLKYKGGAEAVWTIGSGDDAVTVKGESVQIQFPEDGVFQGSMQATSICNTTEVHDFRLKVIQKLGSPNLSIENGLKYTSKANINLDHLVVGADRMLLSTKPDCSGNHWEDYSEGSVIDVFAQNAENRVYAKFSNALRETSCVGASITHDTLAPSLRLQNLPEALSNVDQVQIGLLAEDTGVGLKQIYCRNGGKEFLPCSVQFVDANLKEGNNRFEAFAEDKLGNRSQIMKSDYVIDRSKPSLRWFKKPEAYTKASKLDIAWRAEDKSGIKNAKCSLDAVVLDTCKPEMSLDSLMEGPHQVSVQVYDKAGNKSEIIDTNFTVDRTAPVVTITNTPLDPSVEKSASISFSVKEEGVGGVTAFCAIDGAQYSKCVSPFRISNLENGIHHFDVYASDALGNTSAPVRYTWEVDDGLVSEEILVGEVAKKVDIVVVIDNSSSMKKEQREMGQRFGDFVSSLNGLDWQLGIITTNARENNQYAGGRLQNFANPNAEPIWMINRDMPKAEQYFRQTIQRKEDGFDTEEGIHAIRKFLDREDSNYLREEAHFATIIISDEDERSRGAGLKSYNKPKNLVEAIKTKYAGRKVYSNHSIVWRPGDRNCERRGGKYEARTYAELSDMTDGILGDVCSDDYTSQLLDIGDRIQETAFSIPLKCVPRDLDGDGVSDISIKYSPKPDEEIEHRLRKDKLYLTPYPPKGTKVHLVYRCQR